jgi:signal transduction histidine kinase
MIKLVPDWAQDYQAFWNSVRNRNLWLIHMRYGAVVMLATIFFASNLFNIELSDAQISALILITAVNLLYNFLLHRLRRYLKCTPGKFNPLHFSLLQIVLDLSTLMLLVYYTGTIETPLYMLFIFHMIIGSLILPGYVILVIAFGVTFIFTITVGLEYYNIIPHHHIYGIHSVELKQNFNFIISSIGIFNFTMFTAVLITSRIAKRLYKREQELIETLKKLDEAEKAKQKYTMAVVHEIKSPIVAAQSIVEIVKNGYLGAINEKIKEKLERINSRNDEALRLINNILRISRLKLLGEVSLEKVDLKETVNELIDQKKEVISNKDINLKFNEKCDSSVIEGDKVLLNLVVSNILGNAIKYTKNTGTIEISICSAEGKIQLEISDNGIGIPKEDLEKIFRQFFRASNLPSKNIEGSGLGLSLVKEIVERLSGTIEIKSPSKIGDEENPGTSVVVELPISQKN